MVLGLFFDYFFYRQVPGINFPLYVSLIVIGLFAISSYSKKQLNKQILWLLLPLTFFSLMVFVHSSELLTFLNVSASLFLLLIIAEVSFKGRVKNFLVSNYIHKIFLPFKFMRPLFLTLRDIFAFRGIRKDKKILSPVIKGIVMAIPVMAIFLLLFSSADLIFQKYLSNLIDINIQPDTISRAILILLATLAFIGAYAYIFRQTEESATPQQNDTPYSVGQIEIAIFFGLINVLFFIFILVQLAYLFGGGNNISAQGFTYSEYARRGFFELIAVAIISFLLLWTTEKYIVKLNKKHTPLFIILSAALIIQVILIMFSAFTRLALYEQAFGFTTLRLYSHAFVILLAFIFLLLLYKILRNLKENTFAFCSFIAIILFLTALNIQGTDAFIARRNIELFAKTGKLDIFYLSRLSDDAIPDTIKLLSLPNEDLRKSFARTLYWRTQNNSASLSKWQSLNLSRLKAAKILKTNMIELEQYKDYQQQNFESAFPVK